MDFHNFEPGLAETGPHLSVTPPDDLGACTLGTVGDSTPSDLSEPTAPLSLGDIDACAGPAPFAESGYGSEWIHATDPSLTPGFVETSVLATRDLQGMSNLPDVGPELEPAVYSVPADPYAGGEVQNEPFTGGAEHGSAVDGELRFGAGTCSHCGGKGYTVYISSQTKERCWYCDGSGVAA